MTTPTAEAARAAGEMDLQRELAWVAEQLSEAVRYQDWSLVRDLVVHLRCVMRDLEKIATP